MDTPSSTSGGAAGTVSGAVDAAKEQAAGLVDKARGAASERLEGGVETATGALSNVAEVLHDASDSLREHDQDAFARYAEVAAQQVEQFTEAIRGRSVGDLLDEAERFARREPGLFLGGAFLLGIFGSRFLKSGMGGAASGGPSTRDFLSGMTLPGGASGGAATRTMGRPASSGFGVAGGVTAPVAHGEAGMSAAAGSSMAGGHVTQPSGGSLLAGGLSGGHLPADNPAAAGTGSLRTAVGTPGAGADAAVRSGVGASPLSGETAGMPTPGMPETRALGSDASGVGTGSGATSAGSSGASGTDRT